MQIDLLEVEPEQYRPEELLGVDVPTTKDRLDDMEDRLQTVENSLSLNRTKPAKNRTKKFWKDHWGNFAQWGAIVVVLGLAIYNGHSAHSAEDFDLRVDKRIDTKNESGNSKLNDLEQRMSKVEGKLDVLLSGKHLVESARYAKRGDIAMAINAAESAHISLVSAIVNKAPAPQEYFRDSVKTLSEEARISYNKPELSQQLHVIRVLLAEYRSALIPKLPIPNVTTVPLEHAFTINGIGASINKGVFDFSNVKGNAVQIMPPLTGSLSENIHVNGSTFIGGTQELDGVHWDDVTFINMRVIYKGGETEMRNVKFINCTFDLPNDINGARIADYVALIETNLRVGSS
jgi:hypothetical protein